MPRGLFLPHVSLGLVLDACWLLFWLIKSLKINKNGRKKKLPQFGTTTCISMGESKVFLVSALIFFSPHFLEEGLGAIIRWLNNTPKETQEATSEK